MSKPDPEINLAVDIITKEPDSPVYQFINAPSPENDMAYLEMWFDYLQWMKTDNDQFDELAKTGWLALENVAKNFQVRHQTWRIIKDIMHSALKKRLNGISFKPRLEQYLETFPDQERDDIRRLILAYLMLFQGKYFSDNLIDLGEKVNLSKKFLYSLKEDHNLFKDKILEIESSGFNRDKPLLHTDLEPNPAIFKIFASVDVSEKELVMLKDCPLISMFGLMDESYIDQLQKELTKFDDIKDDDEIDDGINDNYEDDYENEDIDKLLKELEKTTQKFQDSDPEDKVVEVVSENDKELSPYKDDLEYLYNEFLWIKDIIEIRDSMEKPYSFDREDQKKIASLEQNSQKQRRICEVRLKKSREKKFTPRLEALGDLLKLNENERNILKVLITSRLFATQNSYKSNVTVGEVLIVLFENAIDRIKSKKLFLKNSKLVSSNILQLEMKGIDRDLFSCDLIVDNRLVEYLIGENYDISNYIEGSVLYKPSTKLESVIIPDEQKGSLLDIIDHFPTFLKTKHEFDLSSVVEYGDSLVLLFVGPSGTGKTMLSNAIANYLKKKILIFNLNNRSDMKLHSYGNENIISVLFREARMNDAILFFDEAEQMLENRINELLIEIEKHQGIVIFATNASFRIDEGMRRRINYIQHFPDPGPALRRKIWEIHLPASVRLEKDVDLDLLAQRFEINGGLIKNAVFSALAKAVSENSSQKPVIKQKHLTDGAKEQLRNKLFMSHLQEHKIPERGFESLVLENETMDILRDLANIEKARKVLTGEWGFNEIFPDHNGFAVLFHGPPGTGKTHTAEALAYETGRTLKIVNYAQVVSMWVGGTEKALEALFKEVADSESILLFDEADALFASRTAINSANDRFLNTETDVLLSLIERFNSIAILTTNYIDNIDKAFFRRMQYIVEFKEPDQEMRHRLWKTLCPSRLPLSKDVDFMKLATQFHLNGGDIKNTLIRAATRRALRVDDNREITMNDLLEACKETENQKQNKKKKIGY